MIMEVKLLSSLKSSGGYKMNELNKTKFQIIVDKDPKGLWSFGMFICHFDDETYILFNLFKISIAIGKLYINWGKEGKWE